MKTLLITAHPSTQGFTHRIAKSFASVRSGCTILDLYLPENAQPFLRFENSREMSATPERDRFQKMIAEADELVFVFPIWWGDAPAILKNFIDSNFSAGFAFRYETGRPQGLLQPKTARVYATCDAPGWLMRFVFGMTQRLWTMGRLGFCGLKVKSYRLFDQRHNRDELELQKWLAVVAADAKV